MKFLTIPFTFLFFLSLPVYAEDDALLHLSLSAAFGYVGENIIHNKVDTDGERIAYGTILGSVPGFAKELTDDDFSGSDMAVNVAGAFIGSYFATRINRNLVANIQKQNDGYMLGFVYTD